MTILGLGAMGRTLAGAFLTAGHPTTVWNRSPGRDEELLARGAKRAATVADAVRASPLVVVCVLDDAASRAILEPVASVLTERTLVNLTSDTPERARQAASWAAEHQIDYLDGAIMVPTEIIGQPEALLLCSGASQAFERHRATLGALGGNIRYLGSDHGMAALYDLALLDIFYSSMGALVHAFALVGADGIAARTFLPFANAFIALLPEMAESMAQMVDDGRHPGTLDNLRMEAAGIEHIVEATRTRGIDASCLLALHEIFGRAIAAGHGGDSFSSIINVLRKQRA